MKIYLVRHGIAYEPGETGYEDDTQRPLTDKGREKMNKVAHVLKRLNVKPDVIFRVLICVPIRLPKFLPKS